VIREFENYKICDFDKFSLSGLPTIPSWPGLFPSSFILGGGGYVWGGTGPHGSWSIVNSRKVKRLRKELKRKEESSPPYPSIAAGNLGEAVGWLASCPVPTVDWEFGEGLQGTHSHNYPLTHLLFI